MFFPNFCSIFSLKKRVRVVKPMPEDDHEEAVIMQPHNRSSRPEHRDAWESYTYSEA